jgi:hypothetical protein
VCQVGGAELLMENMVDGVGRWWSASVVVVRGAIGWPCHGGVCGSDRERSRVGDGDGY